MASVKLMAGTSKTPAAKTKTLKGVLDPMADGVPVPAGVAMEHGFLAFLGDEIEQHATTDRTGCSHERIQGHARRVTNRELYQQQVVHHGKGQDGRIEKGNQKQPGRAEPRRECEKFLPRRIQPLQH